MKERSSKRIPSVSSENTSDEPALHTIWSGTISFSLVAIPVQLVKAVKPGRVLFRMLHGKDYSPLSRRMYCPRENKIVHPHEIVRGYEIGPDAYIVVTDEELESLTPERSRTIEIIEFVDVEDVDTIYYDHPYYVVPLKGGEKAYQLLARVMSRTGKAGLAKFVLAEREYVVAVKSVGGALALSTLHYSQEILLSDDIAPRHEKIGSEEKGRMKKIVKEMVSDFNPKMYADERRNKILKLLEKKAKKGLTVEAPQMAEAEGGGGPCQGTGGEHAQGEGTPVKKIVAEVSGKKLSLSNLEKDLYPSYGFTKAHVLEYYRRIAPFILPHLKNRALTLKRYPDGVDGKFFFEKRCPAHRPSWVATAKVQDQGEKMTVCLANDPGTLLWVENLASLELHVPLARAFSPMAPDYARVALIIRDLLSELGLACHVKTSGKKGLHVYVPLNRKEATFGQTASFSKATAEALQRSYPDMVTSKIAKEHRKKKVFINWSQNHASKTMVCVYSLRARERPLVSFPLTWEELQESLTRDDPNKLKVLHSEAVMRLEESGDSFGEVLARKQTLPYL